MTDYGEMREDILHEPVSGKALPVYQGEVLRITQEVGGQCVDFNCFNLHDYKERMSVGHMRRQGFRLGRGDYVISAPPRSRLMMYLLEMPDTCVTDLLGSRCSADLYEATWQFESHTNCQDTLAEAIGEYGLTPDDTHDSFNLWMNTGWDDRGRFHVRRNTGRRGDAVDLLALMDVLAVPIICGDGETQASNSSVKPIRVQVFKRSEESDTIAFRHLNRFGRYKNQRSLEDYRVRGIRTDRELKRDPDYKPQFTNFPLEMQQIEVQLNEQEYEQVELLISRGFADDAEDAIRSTVMEWYLKNRSEPNPFALRP